MYLSRVEMTGFKSFADKTVIEFDRGMTAVVGPNGSGKSNLSEAIRWVLGEQSAKSLRGSKMEDIIFNGTQERKAVNLAKVTLVLNNEDRYLDYDLSEISITRSLNRNGESHYYINNESVRLKDIVDLLLDSGLGKNSFAMISQGKVESIFLSRPEERRSIFEEAAGVQKYQLRKQEAERKLIKSQDHLNRLKDIIHEIHTQMKPLKKQSETAIVFEELNTKLQQLEISFYAWQIAQRKTEWQTAQSELDKLQVELEQLNQSIQTIMKSSQQHQQSLDECVELLDQITQRYQKNLQAVEQAKSSLNMIDQELTFNESASQEKNERLNQQNEEIAQLVAEQHLLNKNIQNLSATLEMEQIEQAKLETTKTSFLQVDETTIESKRMELMDCYQEEVKVKNTLQQSQQRLYQLESILDKLKQQQEDSQKTQSKLNQEKEVTLKKLESISQKMKLDQQAHDEIEKQHIKTKQHMQQIQQQLFESERETNRLQATIHSLQKLQDDYVGYYAGVRSVMKQSHTLSGIIGPVADLIKVDERFQLAIDIALGNALQQIVVLDDRSAQMAIEYLKKQKAGRATFLPRTNVKPRFLEHSLLSKLKEMPGFIAIASDLVTTEEENVAVMQSLLGTTVVVDSLSQAQAIAKQFRFSLRIVTLEGEILTPGGAITGGHQKNQQTSMLKRHHDLEQAQQHYQQNEQQRQHLDKKMLQFSNKLQQMDEQHTKMLKELQMHQLHHQQQTETLKQVDYQLSENHKMIKVIELDINTAYLEKEENQQNIATCEVDLNHIKQTIEQISTSIEEMTSTQHENQQQLSQVSEQLTQLQMQSAIKQTELQQNKQRLKQVEKSIEQLEQQLKDARNIQKISKSRQDELQQQRITFVQQHEQLLEESQLLYQKMDEIKENRTLLNQKVRACESQLAIHTEQKNKLIHQQAKLQSKVEKITEMIDSDLIYLNETYQMTFEAASQQSTSLQKPEQAKSEIKQLKQQIAQLGPINIAAIEDYKQLNERYEHLKAQETDLLTAMQQLHSTMNEMDEEVIKRFSESFTAINTQFKLTFQRLFGGGQAYLELTDPSDLLTTGVDIIAQPPGKRKQHLALLSGGERAFTAIALLFAILETKPVPFCLLDEVEAALDDANVWRYGEYLQHFTHQTQFIVITHRKGTMEHADVLYGVTMERSGVSKLASVRLSEAAL